MTMCHMAHRPIEWRNLEETKISERIIFVYILCKVIIIHFLLSQFTRSFKFVGPLWKRNIYVRVHLHMNTMLSVKANQLDRSMRIAVSVNASEAHYINNNNNDNNMCMFTQCINNKYCFFLKFERSERE